MDDAERKKIEEWARREKRLSKAELGGLEPCERDRYAFERGSREHALDPGWGIAAPMVAVVRYAGADHDNVAEMIRTELEGGEEAAEVFLDAI